MECDRTITLGATIVAMATSSRTATMACVATTAGAIAIADMVTTDMVIAAVAMVGSSVIAARSGITIAGFANAIDLTVRKAGIHASLSREHFNNRSLTA